MRGQPDRSTPGRLFADRPAGGWLLGCWLLAGWLAGAGLPVLAHAPALPGALAALAVAALAVLLVGGRTTPVPWRARAVAAAGALGHGRPHPQARQSDPGAPGRVRPRAPGR